MAARKKRPAMTPAQQEIFVETLAVTCNVTQSAMAAKSNYQAAYRMRRQSAPFRRRWLNALAEAVARLELRLLQRALGQKEELPEGVEAADASRKEPSDRVILHLLAMHRPSVAAATGRGGGTREDVRPALFEKLDRMRAAAARAAGD